LDWSLIGGAGWLATHCPLLMLTIISRQRNKITPHHTTVVLLALFSVSSFLHLKNIFISSIPTPTLLLKHQS